MALNVSPASSVVPSHWRGETRESLERKAENRLEQKQSSISSLASEALNSMEEVALQDTLEDMSLMLGNRLKGRGKATAQESAQLRDDKLAQLAEQMGGERLDGMLLTLEANGQQEQLPALYEKGELSFSDATLLLAGSIARQAPGSKKHKKLSTLLEQLLKGEKDWSLTLFSELELGQVDHAAQEGLRQIVQRHHQQQHQESTEGMWQWFNDMRGWGDRRQRIKILLRTFSWELSSGVSDIPMEKLITSLLSLKKLLLFLGIEDYAKMLSRQISLPVEDILAEILLVIELRWGQPGWFIQRLGLLNIPEEKQILWLLRLKDILKFLPEICFLDEQQRKQLMETIEQLADEMS
ncbi:TyeA family type III secretion system gatekeeper subunit [Salmonella enterica]|nr:TyeA family type III secretion system gatekeeper subunit [Salmonella enterica]EFQ6618167.1 TyeA family type III secretion system gatekeeper subunit [Salmonella enterica]